MCGASLIWYVAVGWLCCTLYINFANHPITGR